MEETWTTVTEIQSAEERRFDKDFLVYGIEHTRSRCQFTSSRQIYERREQNFSGVLLVSMEDWHSVCCLEGNISVHAEISNEFVWK